MNFLSHENKGACYAIISGLLFGLVGYFGMSIINANLSVSNMLFWRFLVSSILISFLLLPKLKSIRVSFVELLKVIFYGSAFYSLSTMIYFTASKCIGTGIAMVIFFIFPAIVLFLNWLLYKTRITKIFYAALALIMVGLMLLVDISDFTFDVMGIGLALLSACLYACYIVASKRNNLPPLLSTLMVSIGCMITCFMGAIMSGSFVIPSTPSVCMHIIGMGVICTALPILFFLESLKYISSEKASMLSVFEPVFVVIFGVILMNEKISMLQIFGIITILSGASMALIKDTKK